MSYFQSKNEILLKPCVNSERTGAVWNIQIAIWDTTGTESAYWVVWCACFNFMFKSHLFFFLTLQLYVYFRKFLEKSKCLIKLIHIRFQKNSFTPLHQSSMKIVREVSQADTLPSSDKDERYGFPSIVFSWNRYRVNGFVGVCL